MVHALRLAAVTVLLSTTIGLSAQPSGGARLDRAFAAFWAASSRVEAAAAVVGIVQSGASFDAAYAGFRAGRTYRKDVPRGVVRISHSVRSQEFIYTVDVPATYDPARRFQVRVHLHGGVMRPEGTPRGSGAIGNLAGAEQIYVIPNSWADAQWWSDAQLENLRAILDTVKRTYNVDENRIVLSGVSDGGTAAYYVAMRDTTPYASFLPLNGYIAVLANPSLELGEGMFPNNLRNKPFFVVNGGLDPLYPAARVEPFVKHFQQNGVETIYVPQPNGAHNTAWWPEVKDAFEGFVREHPRHPLPDAITWETDETTVGPRAHWLVIDRLAAKAETPLPDLNDRVVGAQLNFGVRTRGMRVTSVVSGSNAEQIGLRSGDVVQAVNGRTLPEGLPLLELLGSYNPGTRLTFRLARDGKTVDASGEYEPEMMPEVVPIFPHARRSGRVDLVRDGNTVRASTSGVAAFTLLLSPDSFDFSKPVTVIANGRTVFNARVERSLATLATWAAQDNDRTMLFGAELQISVP